MSALASAAKSAGLNIEEVDVMNEADLQNLDLQARMVFDNTNAGSFTPVLAYLAQALSYAGYSQSEVVTLSVITDSPADLNTNYPCGSVYQDAAQVLPSSELLASIGGSVIGSPVGGTANGTMLCGGSTSVPPGGNQNQNMISIPAQWYDRYTTPPVVVDMHAKPCMQIYDPATGNYICDYNGVDSINTPPNQTQAAQDTYSMAWDFLYYRYIYNSLPQPAIVFGETWSNSTESCNGFPDAGVNDTLTNSTVGGYQQSCLIGNTGCFADNGGANPQAGVNPNPASVVFRPWGAAISSSTSCVTPLSVGAPGGLYKY